MITPKAFELLDALRSNNNRDWFQAHKDEIALEVQRPFADMLEAISAKLTDAPLPLSGGAHTMFRMNRDVRFSKDKSPYNSHVSGVLTPSGSKSETGGLLYLHLDADGGFMASGYYRLTPKDLGPIRDRIVSEPERFQALLKELAEAGLNLSRELSLKTMPQGYAQHADSWYADYLKLQTFMVRIPLVRSEWESGAVVEKAAAVGRASAPLIGFRQP